MFAQKWRERWGLATDPFACEDADKDLILSQIDLAAVHSGFDRVFGDPRSPSPGIVFGEKGSGKSGLRLMMRRRLEEHVEKHPEARVFWAEYIDFNGAIEELSRRLDRDGGPTAAGVIGSWEIADHLDAILSLGITKLVDAITAGETFGPGHRTRPKLGRKQRLDLQILTTLYYRSKTRTVSDALGSVRFAAKLGRPGGSAGRWLMTLLGLAIAAAPHLVVRSEELSSLHFLGDHPLPLYGLGLVVALFPWLRHGVLGRLALRDARNAGRGIRVLAEEPGPLADILHGLSSGERAEFALPDGTSEAVRYDLLQRFLGLLEQYGYKGFYVLMDRVDEPTLLSDNAEWMREFVARILDIKLLQHPALALKLFLPIEMEALWRHATPDQLKRMRLDKSNLIPELKWTGRELYEIADQRLKACATGSGSGSGVSSGSGSADAGPRRTSVASATSTPSTFPSSDTDGGDATAAPASPSTGPTPRGPARQLSDLFAPDLALDHVLETLTALGTPRYAFGFLSEAVGSYVRDLPNDLSDDDDRWRLPRAHFDVTRAGWLDRAGLLRRTLN